MLTSVHLAKVGTITSVLVTRAMKHPEPGSVGQWRLSSPQAASHCILGAITATELTYLNMGLFMGVIFQFLPSLKAVYLLLYLYSGIAVLLLIGKLSLNLSTPYVVALWLTLALPIAYTLFWKFRQRRRALLTGYFYSDSPVPRLLKGGLFMFIPAVLLALILSLSLLLALSREDKEFIWLAFAAIMPFWVLSHSWLRARLKNQAKRHCLSYVTGQILFWLWGLLLLLFLVRFSFFVPVADVRDISFTATLEFYAGQAQAKSKFFTEVLAAFSAVDGALLWGVQNLTSDVSSYLVKTLLWGVILLRDWLFVWPLLLLCQLGFFRIYRYESKYDQ